MSGSHEPPAQALPPKTRSLKKLKDCALNCKACPLYRRATQTVFGEGSSHAQVMLVGEQPGDREDQEGRPFVGPAGTLLSRALEDAGIDRSTVYVTNAVKHFKWKERGKRRIHAKPLAREIAACKPWLEAELRLLKPKFLICLGATAARAVCDRTVKISSERGQFFTTQWSELTLVTVHPSAVLRLKDHASREKGYSSLVSDLALVKKASTKARSARGVAANNLGSG